MVNLVLVPIFLGIIALIWANFFWFIKVKSVQVLWATGAAAGFALMAGLILAIWAPSNALVLILVAVVGISPICKTIEYRNPAEALFPLPFSLVIYSVLMLCAYALST